MPNPLIFKIFYLIENFHSFFISKFHYYLFNNNKKHYNIDNVIDLPNNYIPFYNYNLSCTNNIIGYTQNNFKNFHLNCIIFTHSGKPQFIKKVKEVQQKMNDPHVYEEDGVAWTRIFTSPKAIVDGRMNPDCPRDFAEKTAKKKMTVGDMWDASAELSEKRATVNGGIDPIKQKAIKDYAKKCKGKLHPQTVND